ncbi:MAG: alpha-amylase family glycosyl hydrolase [Candidatus Hydrogenedentota bacterium]
MKKSRFIFSIALILILTTPILSVQELSYDNPKASKVIVAGDWVEWADAGEMEKRADGKWYFSLNGIEPGRHEYKFKPDGNWEDGPNRIIIITEDSFEEKTLDEVEYRTKNAMYVEIAGDWLNWGSEMMEQKSPGVFVYPANKIPFGRHEYKFKPNGQWEGGDNRVLHINEEGKIYKPIEFFSYAGIDDFNKITLILKRGIDSLSNIKFEIDNDATVIDALLSEKEDIFYNQGYKSENGYIVFLFLEQLYCGDLDPSKDRVFLAGEFNNWTTNNSSYQLTDDEDDDLWIFKLNKNQISGDKTTFKFVVNGNQWIAPSALAPNALDDGKGNINFSMDLSQTESKKVIELTTTPLDISNNYYLTVTGLWKKPIKKMLNPANILNKFYSNKRLGTFFDTQTDKQVFRLFSPRAKKAKLYIFKEHNDNTPIIEEDMIKDKDGVWETSISGYYDKYYYKYRIDGHKGEGEAYDPNFYLSDLYARANVQHDGKSIILQDNYFDGTFSEWTDEDYKTPAISDLVISEIHIRDFTADPSSGVTLGLRGKYLGFVETSGKGTGIDHLCELGVNAIEFLPLHEFDDNYKAKDYHWGYMSSLYFPPESSYATDWTAGKQVTEFKKLVDTLHGNGIAVIVDVVYNHVGSPNYYAKYDNKYYFRFTEKGSYSNNSGCGNDFKTESPMARKLIIDSLIHWIKEYHIDGFRFDLAALIDMDTLKKIDTELRKIKEDVILIAEPWGMGVPDIKGKVKDSKWLYWNDDFRNKAKDFAHSRANRSEIEVIINGTTAWWAPNPAASVNYVESHDDRTLADDLTGRTDHNAKLSLDETDIKRNKICATLIFMSLGVPMIAEGQEINRSKGGIGNSYNAGDEVNAVKWSEKTKYLELYQFYKGLIALRRSDKGRCLRISSGPPPGYIRFIHPEDNNKAIGYIVNSHGINNIKRIVVIINPERYKDVNYSFELPGNSTYTCIADIDKIDLNGIDTRRYSGSMNLRLEPLNLRIFVED